MKRFVITMFLAVLLMPVSVFAFGGCESDCMKCHALSTDEVKQILGKLGAAEANPLEVKMSPIKGLWEVSLDDRGNMGIMYIGFSKKHVIAGPIFEVETATNKTLESAEKLRQEQVRYLDVSKVPVDKALLMGEKDAKYKVLVFTDPDCPYCARLHIEMKKILAERKDIAFYIKFMPLSFHPDAYWKSQSILCKKSLEMLENNFAQKEVPKPDCDDKEEIDNNIKIAQESGITGTPTLVMPDGMLVMGAVDAKRIIELVTNPPAKPQVK
jgi:thiol:disulfide interchange protein DsbC